MNAIPRLPLDTSIWWAAAASAIFCAYSSSAKTPAWFHFLSAKTGDEGTSHLSNIFATTKAALIYRQRQPQSYFQKDETLSSKATPVLDLAVFTRISEALGITCRYVGEEPTSLVISMYNKIRPQSFQSRHPVRIIQDRSQWKTNQRIHRPVSA